jgi:hypothetical protein
MSLVCWKALGSLALSKSSNMLTAFDGHSFCPHGILPAFLVQLGGKMVEVEVEVVDAPLDYNLLLGHNWTYAMVTVVSFIFRVLCFPHQGEIVTIDQLSFAYSSPNTSVGPSIPVIDNSQPTTENIGVKMYSSLMGTFDFSARFTTFTPCLVGPLLQGGPFLSALPILVIHGPYLLQISSCEGKLHDGMAMPLSTEEIAYQVVLDSSADPDPVTSQTDEEDPVLRPVWATSLSCSHDFLDETFPLTKPSSKP